MSALIPSFTNGTSSAGAIPARQCCRRLFTLASCIIPLLLLGFFTSGHAETLSGMYRGKQVTYQLVNGRAVYEGDILLERVDPIKVATGNSDSGKTGLIQPFSLGVSYPSLRWPKVNGVHEIPYVITTGSANLNSALSQFNSSFSGLLQFVPRAAQSDYVNINLDLGNSNGICRSNVGRIGGVQVLDGSASCAVGTLLHEMGHTVGLYHEQSRADRDQFITVLYSSVIKDSRINFDQLQDNAQPLTLFDYASVMMYSPFAFSRNGGPALESIPAGIPLSNAQGYTSTDTDAIRRLYGVPPQQVTIDSNPSGLQVLVDGVSLSTPQSINWALNSVHTLAVAAGSQTRNGVTYIYGRWNDNPAASHSITVLRGNGTLAAPVNRPAVTVYTANFVQLVPYNQSVEGSGSVSASPPPQAYPPAPGQFYVARQQVTLQATANPGNSFYAYFNAPFFLPGGLSENPKTFHVPDDGNQVNFTAAFTPAPVASINTSPTGLGLLVDGGFWYAPKIFAPPYDPAWTPGSSHQIVSYTPQLPYSSNTRYVFSNWSDGGALAHNITTPGINSSFTANFTPQYLLARYASPSCAGNVNLTPTSPSADNFYSHGSSVSLGQVPNPGWVFTGWRFDLTGLASPQFLSVDDEQLAVAAYNTVSTPLTVSSLSPASAVAGSNGFPLFINGSGFTSNSLVLVNNLLRTTVFVNSSLLAVTLIPTDLANPGAFSIAVENFPPGAPCGVFATRDFLVASHSQLRATPPVQQFPGQALHTLSAARGVQLQNISGAPVTISSITVSSNFTTTNNCPVTLAAGASCVVAARFMPTVSGLNNGVLTITDTAADSPQLINITGSGLSALTVAPPYQTFGTAATGSSSAPRTVTLSNNLDTPLNFSFATSANYSASGSGSAPCVAMLAARTSCTLAVTFRPSTAGLLHGALTITHAVDFSPQLVGLTGTGVGGPLPPLSISPASLSFSNTLLGTTSAPRSVTLTNTRVTAISLGTISSSGNYAVVPGGGNPCGTMLGTGASCTLNISFSPSNAGIILGTVNIPNSATSNIQSINLAGFGTYPLSFLPPILNFPAQTVATSSASQTLILLNNQSSAFTLGTVTASGGFSATPTGVRPCSNGVNIAPFSNCTLNVRFTPGTIGLVRGAISVTHSAGRSPQSFYVSGIGQ